MMIQEVKRMSGEILKGKTIEVTMVLDGKSFIETTTIPEGTAERQWLICQRIGDMLSKTIMFKSDIKDGLKQVNS